MNNNLKRKHRKRVQLVFLILLCLTLRHNNTKILDQLIKYNSRALRCGIPSSVNRNAKNINFLTPNPSHWWLPVHKITAVLPKRTPVFNPTINTSVNIIMNITVMPFILISAKLLSATECIHEFGFPLIGGYCSHVYI